VGCWLCECILKVVELKCYVDTYKPAISNGCLVCMCGVIQCGVGRRKEERGSQADVGHRGTLIEIGGNNWNLCAIALGS